MGEEPPPVLVLGFVVQRLRGLHPGLAQHPVLGPLLEQGLLGLAALLVLVLGPEAGDGLALGLGAGVGDGVRLAARLLAPGADHTPARALDNQQSVLTLFLLLILTLSHLLAPVEAQLGEVEAVAAGEGGHRHGPGVPAVQEACDDDDDNDDDNDHNDDDVDITAAGHVEAAVAAVLPPVLPAQLSRPLLGQGAALLGIYLHVSFFDGHFIDVIDSV